MEILGITPGATRKVPSDTDTSGTAPEPVRDSADQMSLFQEPADAPPKAQASDPDAVPHLLVEKPDEEVERVRIRELFLVSVIVHLALILFVVTHPGFFAPKLPVFPKPEKVTMLYEPPLERPRKVPKLPPIPPLPRANGSLDSQQPPVPAQKQLPPIQAPPKPAPPQAAAPQPPAPAPEKPLEAAKSAPAAPQHPSLEPLEPTKPTPDLRAQLQLPEGGTEAVLRDLARERATGEGGGDSGGSDGEYSDIPGNPNSLPGPQIISDTMGVNFDPYLLRIYLLIRKNWYSVIPEIVRMGKQGRVSLEFSIRRDGSMFGLVMTSGSGTDAMDSAAMASVRMSNPFPTLPPAFPGSDIRLRFGYCYNIEYSKCAGH